MANVWRDLTNKLFHDECFDSGESRIGYEKVTLDELNEDDICNGCAGPFIVCPDDDDDDDDDDYDYYEDAKVTLDEELQ